MDETENEPIEVSSALESTNDSIQSFRACVAAEDIESAQYLTDEEFASKSNLVLKHLRSQQKVSLKSIEEMYALQLRRNTTSDRLLSGMEK